MSYRRRESDGIQQGLEYAATLNIPLVFLSNDDGFVFHDRTGTSAEKESNLALDQFPSPADTRESTARLEAPDAERRGYRRAAVFRRRQRERAPLTIRSTINATIKAIANGQNRVLS
jgi:type I restriction enzyme R subunit